MGQCLPRVCRVLVVVSEIPTEEEVYQSFDSKYKSLTAELMYGVWQQKTLLNDGVAYTTALAEKIHMDYFDAVIFGDDVGVEAVAEALRERDPTAAEFYMWNSELCSEIHLLNEEDKCITIKNNTEWIDPERTWIFNTEWIDTEWFAREFDPARLEQGKRKGSDSDDAMIV